MPETDFSNFKDMVKAVYDISASKFIWNDIDNIIYSEKTCEQIKSNKNFNLTL